MYLISATSIRYAIQLAEEHNIESGNWKYIPWGNSHAREEALYDFKRNGTTEDKLIGYWTYEDRLSLV